MYRYNIKNNINFIQILWGKGGTIQFLRFKKLGIKTYTLTNNNLEKIFKHEKSLNMGVTNMIYICEDFRLHKCLKFSIKEIILSKNSGIRG